MRSEEKLIKQNNKYLKELQTKNLDQNNLSSTNERRNRNLNKELPKKSLSPIF